MTKNLILITLYNHCITVIFLNYFAGGVVVSVNIEDETFSLKLIRESSEESLRTLWQQLPKKVSEIILTVQKIILPS